MLFIDLSDYEKVYRDNMLDWCLGGPKKGGWTREGDRLCFPFYRRIGWEKRGTISIDEALSKNRSEVEKWHINFLKQPHPLEETAYYRDYLMPRMDHWAALRKASEFLSLFENVRRFGFDPNQPVVVVRVHGIGLFRIDGCHRLCCGKMLDLEQVPAIVLKAVT
jgi:hypothetical protein